MHLISAKNVIQIDRDDPTFIEGEIDRLNATPVLANPYPKGSLDRIKWAAGWHACDNSLRTGKLPGEK